MKKVVITSLFLSALFFAKAAQTKSALAQTSLATSAVVAKNLLPHAGTNLSVSTSFVDAYNDMNAILEFSGLHYSYSDLIKHKDSLTSVLNQLETRVTQHKLNVVDQETSTVLADFYEAASNYISRAKELLNSENISCKTFSKRTLNRYNRSLNALNAAYYTLMN